MSRDEAKFADLCLKGEARANEIDDFVDRWHESAVAIPLDEFLGLTHDEYALWVERPDSLTFLLDARKHVPPFGGFPSAAEAYRSAARSFSPTNVEELLAWQRHSGRIAVENRQE